MGYIQTVLGPQEMGTHPLMLAQSIVHQACAASAQLMDFMPTTSLPQLATIIAAHQALHQEWVDFSQDHIRQQQQQQAHEGGGGSGESARLRDAEVSDGLFTMSLADWVAARATSAAQRAGLPSVPALWQAMGVPAAQQRAEALGREKKAQMQRDLK